MAGVPWGGSEELWAGAALNLVGRGYRVSVNVNHWPQPVAQVTQLEKAGCSVHRSRQSHRVVEKVRRRLGVDARTNWLKARSPDLVVISQGGIHDGLLWAEACNRLKLRYALIVQAAASHWWPKPTLAERLREVYARATRCYFVSRDNRDIVQVVLAVSLPNARVIWNPFKVSRDAMPTFPDADGSFRLACVARLDVAQKGQDLLLEVLAQSKWQSRPLTVSFVGSGLNNNQLTLLAEHLGVRNVRWVGQHNDIEKVWAEHHALVLPSRFEGMPLALLEAMWCGRTAIVTDVGGNREILDDEVTGFIAPSATVRFLDEALERAWNRRSDWRRMGIAAAETVRARVPSDPISTFAQEIEGLN